MDEANMSIKKAGQYIEELKKMIPLLTEDSKNPPSESIKENIQEINKYLNKILPEIQSFCSFDIKEDTRKRKSESSVNNGSKRQKTTQIPNEEIGKEKKKDLKFKEFTYPNRNFDTEDEANICRSIQEAFDIGCLMSNETYDTQTTVRSDDFERVADDRGWLGDNAFAFWIKW